MDTEGAVLTRRLADALHEAREQRDSLCLAASRLLLALPEVGPWAVERAVLAAAVAELR